MRAGGGAWVFGGGGLASRTEERADWLVECGGVVCLRLTGILDSLGRLTLPFIERNEEEEEDEGGDVCERGSPPDGEGVLVRSSSSPDLSASSSGSL